MRAQWTSGARPPEPSGWAWWRRGRERTASAADPSDAEAERLLDLAGFADGRLADERRQRVVALITHDPDAAADVAMARWLNETAVPPADERVIVRAAALVDGSAAGLRAVLPPGSQPLPGWRSPVWRGATAWSGLAAAIALASWVGFGLGSGMSLPHSRAGGDVEDAATGGVFDPAPPLVRDFTEGWQT